MNNVLLVIHLLVALAMIGVVLLQRSEGGALGMGGGGGGGGMGGFLTGRGTANLLTRATAILAAAFMVTSLTLSILADGGSEPTSILDDLPVTAPSQDQEPAGPSVPVE
jgi:preprotein translocase subunit SecG